MQSQTDAQGHTVFRAALPMGLLFERTLDAGQVEQARAGLEGKYLALVESLRTQRVHMKDGNVLRYWQFGDTIAAFETDTANALVFVDKLSTQLARDVGYSKSMIDLCRRLKAHFPDVMQLDPQVPFDEYHRHRFDPSLARAAHARKNRRNKNSVNSL